MLTSLTCPTNVLHYVNENIKNRYDYEMAPNLLRGREQPYKGLPMYIFGLKCLYCSGNLNVLGIENSVVATKCSQCGHISNPKPINLSENTIYSKFANKKIEVQYNAKKPRSGEYRRMSVQNQTEIYPDRKQFIK